MASYVGGKGRICKDIYKAIKKEVKNKPVRGYIEPFCGGLSVIVKFTEYECFAYDYNEDLIYLWEQFKLGNVNKMPEITRDYFTKLKESDELSIDKSFAMLFCTFNCFYRRNFVENHHVITERLYHQERFNRIKKNIDFSKLNFKCQHYIDTTHQVLQGGFIIYCDPPYKNTTQQYSTIDDFDSELFWKTVLLWKYLGNYVFVSELTCPIKHEVLFEKVLQVSVSSHRHTMTDKLFGI